MATKPSGTNKVPQPEKDRAGEILAEIQRLIDQVSPHLAVNGPLYSDNAQQAARMRAAIQRVDRETRTYVKLRAFKNGQG